MSPPAGMLRPGAAFAGRYLVETRLGSGGAGEVFRAVDRLSDTRVALKVLFPGAEGAEAGLPRLRREVAILRELRHPGIIRLFDIGESDGLLYLVMEELPGESLRQRLDRRRRLPLPEALEILTRAAEALAAAHDAGVIHRDIKPANIFLCPAGPRQGERVVLLDFGLARRHQDQTLTVTGQFMGTLDYVAPEQLLAQKKVGPPADVYALGLLLWEMLAGSPPFPGSDSISRRIKGELPSPRRDLPRVPGWLRRLLSWMLSPEPERRPADAAAVLDSLRRRSIPAAARLRAAGRTLLRPSGLAAGISALVALALLAASALLPTSLRSQGDALQAVSALGIPVRRTHLPASLVADPLPLDPEALWSRRWLGLESNPYGPDPAPLERPMRSGLLELDLLTGARSPFHPDATAAWLRPFDTRFDHNYHGHALLALPWKTDAGEPLMLALHNHAKHFPTLLNIFDRHGERALGLEHPGRLDAKYVLSRPGHLFLSGKNDALGRRSIVMGLRHEPRGLLRSARLAVPPYEIDSANWQEAAFYTFLTPQDIDGVRDDGDRLVLILGGREWALDPDTGIPLSPEHRGGLTADGYAAAQDRLLAGLRRAGAAGVLHDQAAADLQALGNAAGLAPVQRAVALYQAAVLWTRAGDREAALAALAAIPDDEKAFPGFLRLAFMHEVARGRWQEALALYSEAPRLSRSPEMDRDLVVGALLAGDLTVASDRAARIPPGHHSLQVRALVALHRGDSAAALAALRQEPARLAEPFASYLLAVALLMDGQGGSPEARRALELAEGGRGGGFRIPAAPLAALLGPAAGDAGSPGSRPAAARSPEGPGGTSPLDRLRKIEADRLTRESIVDLYLSFWGQALDATLLLEEEDRDGAGALLADLRSRPVAAAWVGRMAATAP